MCLFGNTLLLCLFSISYIVKIRERDIFQYSLKKIKPVSYSIMLNIGLTNLIAKRKNKRRTAALELNLYSQSKNCSTTFEMFSKNMI